MTSRFTVAIACTLSCCVTAFALGIGSDATSGKKEGSDHVPTRTCVAGRATFWKVCFRQYPYCAAERVLKPQIYPA